MANRRPWTEGDLASLKSLAGKYPSAKIARELDRGLPAIVMKAYEVRISLKRERLPRFYGERPRMD